MAFEEINKGNPMSPTEYIIILLSIDFCTCSYKYYGYQVQIWKFSKTLLNKFSTKYLYHFLIYQNLSQK